MNSRPLVSIIINNFNYERFLAEAIDSACAQTYENTEVLVVDDGSTDASRKIISRYTDRIQTVLKENGGQASAFNAGFDASKGEIILFLDADDLLLPEAVERIVAVWQPETVKVHYLLNGIDANGQSLGYTYPSRGEYLGRGDVVTKLLERGVYGVAPTSANAFSRIALDKIFPIPADKYRISADGYIATCIVFYGKVVAIETPLGAYRVHGNNNWGNAINASKFRSFIEHDLRKRDLILNRAQASGYEVPVDLLFRTNTHLWARLASFRLDRKQHPVKSDSLLKLMYHGIRSTWLYSDLNRQKQLVVTLWFFVVGLLPVPIAKPAISWLLAQESRPKSVEWILNRIRPLLNRTSVSLHQEKAL
ncbi:glycosyltransferase [Acaryochloris marina]|uniref:glycosyltransferase n=1 Tax=Acaryochloris marina TaxID=155978 RepID=UPI001BAFCF73|nr:glycosyltransferase [Acaryochloris marina]QUY44824.1 glycosyltransferase [Acaryochloris marina S15]